MNFKVNPGESEKNTPKDNFFEPIGFLTTTVESTCPAASRLHEAPHADRPRHNNNIECRHRNQKKSCFYHAIWLWRGNIASTRRIIGIGFGRPPDAEASAYA